MMEALKQTRERWLTAFLSADIDTLKSIEAPDFTAVSELGVENTEDRYSVIAQKKTAGQWFKPSAKAQDIDIRYHDHGIFCQVIGTGNIVANGQLIRASHFSELWIKGDSTWQIQSIHVSQANKLSKELV